MKNFNPVSWFDIYVSDFERAKKFYESVFELTLFDLPSEWGKQAFFPFNEQLHNISEAIVERIDNKSNGNNTVIYFESEDCQQELARVEEAGGQILQPKMNIGEFGFVALFSDTEGNTIGLHSKK